MARKSCLAREKHIELMVSHHEKWLISLEVTPPGPASLDNSRTALQPDIDVSDMTVYVQSGARNART
jgi:hypothetical protein